MQTDFEMKLPNALPTIYLAGPIYDRSDADCIGWREQVKQLGGAEFVFLDPMGRDFRGLEWQPGVDRAIVERDKEAIMKSDALIVFFDVPSVGTSMEVFFAWERGKKIVVVNASKAGGRMSPWLTYHSHFRCYSVAGALDFLRGAFRG